MAIPGTKPLARLGKAPGVERVVASRLRARIVRESARFFLRDVAAPARGRPHPYRLRSSGLVVWVEHGTPDVHTLDEIWYSRVYEPPDAVGALLAALPPEAVVLDIGANVGMFVAWAAEHLVRPRVVAYEPDPRNAELLRRMLVANASRLASAELRLGAAGAGDRDVAFVAGEYTTSRIATASTPTGDATVTVRCWDVLPELRACDILKLDVEGGEWEILRDARFGQCGARIVAVEPHAAGAGPQDAVEQASALLQTAGYTTLAAHGLTGGASTVWGWRD